MAMVTVVKVTGPSDVYFPDDAGVRWLAEDVTRWSRDSRNDHDFTIKRLTRAVEPRGIYYMLGDERMRYQED